MIEHKIALIRLRDWRVSPLCTVRHPRCVLLESSSWAVCHVRVELWDRCRDEKTGRGSVGCACSLAVLTGLWYFSKECVWVGKPANASFGIVQVCVWQETNSPSWTSSFGCMTDRKAQSSWLVLYCNCPTVTIVSDSFSAHVFVPLCEVFCSQYFALE